MSSVPGSMPATIKDAFDTNLNRVLNLGIRTRTDAICDSNISASMRKLWSDHVFWTREWVLAAAFNTPNKKAASDRLIKNQNDIGNAIKPIFGNSAGNQLSKLLKEHIIIAVAIVENGLANRKQQMNVSIVKWKNNGDEIARFLNDLNPEFWRLQRLSQNMSDHLSLTLREIEAILRGNYSESKDWFDKVYTQVLSKADYLASGIVQLIKNKQRIKPH